MIPLRLVIGIIFIVHGGQKLFSWFGGGGIEGTTAFFSSLGIAGSGVFAWIVGIAEFGGGIFILTGFLTELSALVLIIDMIVAISKVHWSKGFFVTDGGFEYTLLIIASLLALMVSGQGVLSLDRFITRQKKNLSEGEQRP